MLDGDYFETEVPVGSVAYEDQFPESERNDFPKCRLRYWQMGEIITAIAFAGFSIERLIKEPRWDCHQQIPGTFSFIARK